MADDEQGRLGRVDRIEKDLYYGNGKPALTIRMQQCEDRVDDVKENVTQIRNDLRKVVWFVVLAFLAEVLKLIFVKGI